MKFFVQVFTLGCLLTLLSCGVQNPHEDKKIFRYNEVSAIGTLDPTFAKNQAHIWAVSQLFEGLVRLDENLQVRPALAETWEISPDGLTYLFQLRPNVYFHKHAAFGQKETRMVNAFDFEYSLNRLMDPALAAPGQWVMSRVEGIEALDSMQLKITLKHPFAPFLGLLSMAYCSVVPREVIEHLGDAFGRQPVGTGPFKFQLWKPGVKMVFRKHPNYWMEDEQGQALPYLDGLAIRFIADKQTAFMEFLQGNLEFVSGLDASYKDEVLQANGSLQERYLGKIEVQRIPYLNTEYLGFLMSDSSSTLRSKHLRKAINFGFDRREMIEVLRNNIGTPAEQGMIPAGMVGYDKNAKYGYSYQPDSARYYLRKSGYEVGKDAPIVIATNASYLDLCEYIQGSLSKIGLDVAVEVHPPSTLRQLVGTGKASFFRASWIADYPDAENYLALFYSPLSAPNGPNYTRFESKVYDKLYEQAGRINDPEERIGLYQKNGCSNYGTGTSGTFVL